MNSTQNRDNFKDEISFIDEVDNHLPIPRSMQSSWRVMIIDDDADVHSATTFALGSLEIHGRPLSFVHAYSAGQARDLLNAEKDIAVILLDVVMEKQDAGLQLVSYIRQILGLVDVRIILRTGQPGYAPEIDAIRDYDINDYKTKSELTRIKLFTSVTSAIRSYDQICSISANQQGLENIVIGSAELMAIQGWKDYAAGVLKQITSLLGASTQGFVCGQKSAHQTKEHPFDSEIGIHVIAATSGFSAWLDQPLGVVADKHIHALIQKALHARQHIYAVDATILYFDNIAQRDLTVYLNTEMRFNHVNKRLLGVFSGIVSVGLDNVMLTSRLHNFSFYDPLTGLANRLRLIQILNETLSSERRADSALSLIDIDHFAETNDALGHQFGDLLLCAVADRLLDYFGDACQLARIGSDTFALLGHEEVVNPKMILALFAAPFLVDSQDVQLSATIGLIKIDYYYGDGSEALKDTNIALKRAKTDNRSGYAFFTQKMGVEIRERVRMMHALRGAFESERLFLVYQPQMDMRHGQVIGVEALLRWRTEDGVYVQPEDFIPIAEYSGLIISIGEWVLRSACYELVQLQSLGQPNLQMAINVSQAQFSHPLFMQTLHRALKDTKAPPNCIELEITESMAMKDPESLIKTLQQIKQLGIRVSIDDFGTGFSSLSHLQKLNIDKLKIDCAFIDEIKDGSAEACIAKMVIQLAQNLKLDVIAEGVETEFQKNTLLSFGCFQAQGFYYAKAMKPARLVEWLKGK